jgi:hypothetical protein
MASISSVTSSHLSIGDFQDTGRVAAPAANGPIMAADARTQTTMKRSMCQLVASLPRGAIEELEDW